MGLIIFFALSISAQKLGINLQVILAFVFLIIKNYVFIYLAVLGLCSVGRLSIVVSGFLIVLASPAVEHSLQGMWPSVVAVGSVVADPRL